MSINFIVGRGREREAEREDSNLFRQLKLLPDADESQGQLALRRMLPGGDETFSSPPFSALL